MNRNFGNLNIYLNRLMVDIYPQPEDEGHSRWAEDVWKKWIKGINIKNVLDAGCGDTAFMKPLFTGRGIEYTGIALRVSHPDVINMDFSFLEFEDNSFDLIFARHSLEHSPMALLTLMEWFRVSNHLLCLILPNPNHFGYTGLNHYSVMNPEQVEFLLKRAGWHIIWTDFSEPAELRYMCEKEVKTEYQKVLEGKA